MEQNTSQNIPANLISIISSKELIASLERIEKELGLHIDQTGELYIIISNIILRKAKSSDFTKNVMSQLNVNADMANKILALTNKEIFDVMKSKLQSQTSEPTVKTIESVGGFTFEKERGDTMEHTEQSASDRDKFIESLENPHSHTGTIPPNLPTATPVATSTPKVVAPSETRTEPLVDYLLSKPVGQGINKITVSEPVQPPAQKPVIPKLTPPPLQPTRSSPDPYRESV